MSTGGAPWRLPHTLCSGSHQAHGLVSSELVSSMGACTHRSTLRATQLAANISFSAAGRCGANAERRRQQLRGGAVIRRALQKQGNFSAAASGKLCPLCTA